MLPVFEGENLSDLRDDGKWPGLRMVFVCGAWFKPEFQ
jgi:hypothetical protein